MTLIIDNYDSFTYNLAQAVATISGTEPIVIRNDELSWEELNQLRFDNVILSPGPGRPENARDFGICRRAIEELQCPILGVCLGHQGICLAFGGRLVPAAEIMHGRASRIFHTDDVLFQGVPDGFDAVRYHSLIAEDLPACLETIAWTATGEVMGVRHRTKPIWGVQFHPESICTPDGNTILRNFLFPDAASLFRTLFKDEPVSFWLDSSEGGRSYMGCGSEMVEGAGALERLEADLASRKVSPDPLRPGAFQGGWVGYIGYPDVGQARFVRVDRFMVVHRQAAAPRGNNENSSPQFTFAIDKPDYLDKIAECLAAIRAGESYEVCLTNQLRAETAVDPLAYYENLRCVNPAPFSAFLNFPDLQVACSSPELFLEISAGGHVKSKPVKGTLARAADPEALRTDEKTRAENLMIVDLVRNDLGRVCRAGSVRVPRLMDIETFATVHHMVSTIEGELRPEASAIDCIRAAFPPGSMTGAPKLRTMEIIDRLEPRARGIYSGCIGFLSYTGAATFNVAIRSAVFCNGEVTIGTGGAIVAQSVPEREWEELVLKAEALVRAFDGL